MFRVRIASLFLVLCSLCLGYTQVAAAAKAAPAVVAESSSSQAKLNINSADELALQDYMIGIGAAKAKAIVKYREENGPFSSVDDLLEVKGIGVKTLEKSRDKLTVE
ncbi:ComEA family DNA-binding protein [Pseudomonas sp. JS3066]|jgi:competence protein ComEA|uniref:ComEA family DNA-binding protein n=1 Tax=unclassified Pseudomonas TaxID=196821 RepID=UPI00129DABF1|nr:MULTISPECIES: ComEA family DNA-binding protein [unclassified Pseudomonas]MDH4656639.1 ComEA family DNA-binding protein [Pseudomonas sp. BN606]MRK23037.1 ComEA family DNA-binding protein [Pseudomonas sp. JG-B]WVK95015.1 ComEA family DNA-binding protein [Pseudomonas sp. JS3066]